jgi:hypothetical protein
MTVVRQRRGTAPVAADLKVLHRKLAKEFQIEKRH